MQYFDNAKNMISAADGEAIARSRRTSIETGTAWRVEAKWSHQAGGFWWNGNRYDVISMAKDLFFSPGIEFCRLFAADGSKVDIEAVRY